MVARRIQILFGELIDEAAKVGHIVEATHRPPNRLGNGVLKPRSEEHTSELQSPCNLVCRLLLETKEHTSELQSPCNLVCRLLLEKKNHSCLIVCEHGTGSTTLIRKTIMNITEPKVHHSLFSCI